MKNIETELCKLDIKNVISKIYEDNTKLINKSIRTPQMVESCTSIGTSPNTKTPVTLKSHMSQSTMDIDSSDKLTDKHKHTLKISYN
jgi:transaldolase